MTTYGDCNTTPVAGAKDTETLIHTAVILPGANYTIKKIIVASDAIVEGKSEVGVIELKIDKVSGPFKFPVMSAHTASANTGGSSEIVNVIDVDIQVPGSANVKIYATMDEAAVGIVAGIIYV